MAVPIEKIPFQGAIEPIGGTNAEITDDTKPAGSWGPKKKGTQLMKLQRNWFTFHTFFSKGVHQKTQKSCCLYFLDGSYILDISCTVNGGWNKMTFFFCVGRTFFKEKSHQWPVASTFFSITLGSIGGSNTGVSGSAPGIRRLQVNQLNWWCFFRCFFGWDFLSTTSSIKWYKNSRVF